MVSPLWSEASSLLPEGVCKSRFLGIGLSLLFGVPIAENSQLHMYTSSVSCHGAPPFSGRWPQLSSLPPIPHPSYAGFHYALPCTLPATLPSQGPSTVSLFITVELTALMPVLFSNLSDI